MCEESVFQFHLLLQNNSIQKAEIIAHRMCCIISACVKSIFLLLYYFTFAYEYTIQDDDRQKQEYVHVLHLLDQDRLWH